MTVSRDTSTSGGLGAARRAADEFIQLNAARRVERLEAKDAMFFRSLAECHFVSGMVAFHSGEPPEQTIRAIHAGLDNARTSHELRWFLHPWKMWDYFLYALATRHDEFVHYLLKVPDAQWRTETVKPVPWLVTQVRVLFALHAGDNVAGDHLSELRVAVFERKLARELEQQTPEIHNQYYMLHALFERDAEGFNEVLGEHQAFRVNYWHDTSSLAPVSLIDLNSLGLCRIALSREMPVTVAHERLPLSLLDVTLGAGSA